MYRNTDTTVRRRTAHAIAAAALGATIALAGIPAVQLALPADQGQQAYASTSVDYSDDFGAHILDASAPISLTSSGHTYYFVNMQDAVKYSVEHVGTAKIVLQKDYTGPAPVIDLPDCGVQTLRFDLNGHTWNVTGQRGIDVPGCIDHFGIYGGTLKTSTAPTLLALNGSGTGVGGTIENDAPGGTAVKLTDTAFEESAEHTRVLAPSGTAIEAVGSTLTFSEQLEEVEGTIAYGTDGDAVTNFTLESHSGSSVKILSDFKALDGADKCTFKITAPGVYKQKLPESWLDNDNWYFSWTDNADGTYTLNRIMWGESGIPADATALYNAWNEKYPSGNSGSALYKEYPGPTAAKAELGASAGTPAPGGSTGASGSTSSSSTPAGNTGSSSSGTKAPSGSATVKPAPAKQTAAQKKVAEQKAQKKALSRTKPAKPSVRAYRGHKVKVTFKAAKMPKGVKAKSYQISYRQNGKTRTVTVSAKSYKTFKVTVKHLTKSRKYTFKVRAVAKIGGKTCYSAWSSYSKGIRAK
jgi:hypothetical protein